MKYHPLNLLIKAYNQEEEEVAEVVLEYVIGPEAQKVARKIRELGFEAHVIYRDRVIIRLRGADIAATDSIRNTIRKMAPTGVQLQ